ncbi:MAG TPA: hypothetical protein VMD91_15385 [Candidatus Sulfotelmatobacter sp.]|nr:hypothetical protein [Candidatus Sulfotelmatobacter sp.]
MATATTDLKELGLDLAASGVTLYSPNYSPGISLFTFPQTGSVQLVYGVGNPAPTSVVIYHQGGGQTNVPPGSGQYNVGYGDVLYIFGNNASAKIQYIYN